MDENFKSPPSNNNSSENDNLHHTYAQEPKQRESPTANQPQRPTKVQQPSENTQQQASSVSAASTEQGGVKNAGIRFRWAAFFFDGLFTSVPLALVYFALVFFGSEQVVSLNSTPTIPSHIIIFYAVLTTVYYVYFDIKSGSTPGKKIYGIKVVESDSFNLLNLKRATIRELVAKTSYFIPLIGSVFQLINGAVIFLSKENKAIHDNLVKSRVVIVKKPWSIIKQIGLFIIIVILITIPYLLMAG